MLFFPWLGGFARSIEWLTGRREISAVARLEPMLAKAGGPVAMEAGWRALVEVTRSAFGVLAARSSGKPSRDMEWEAELPLIADFIGKLRFEGTEAQSMPDRRTRLWHAMDHMRKLADNLAEAVNHWEHVAPAEEIRHGIEALEAWRAWAANPSAGSDEAAVAALADCSSRFAALRKSRRAELLEQLGRGASRPEAAMVTLETLRWLDGCYYHAWRLADSIHQAAGDVSTEAAT